MCVNESASSFYQTSFLSSIQKSINLCTTRNVSVYKNAILVLYYCKPKRFGLYINFCSGLYTNFCCTQIPVSGCTQISVSHCTQTSVVLKFLFWAVHKFWLYTNFCFGLYADFGCTQIFASGCTQISVVHKFLFRVVHKFRLYTNFCFGLYANFGCTQIIKLALFARMQFWFCIIAAYQLQH